MTKLLSYILVLSLVASVGMARSDDGKEEVLIGKTAAAAVDSANVIPPTRLRPYAVMNDGNIRASLGTAIMPAIGGYYTNYRDPETGEQLTSFLYPANTHKQFLWISSIWVGGIVNGDTLVSDGRSTILNKREYWPQYPDSGAFTRSWSFADDQFKAVYTDTVTDPALVGWPGFLDSAHVPLGIRITQESYAFSDTMYDDFVILEYTIENISSQTINDGWVGFYADPDIYDQSTAYSNTGYNDDFCASLDTLLDELDPDSHVLIAYAADNDGDPSGLTPMWTDSSVRSAIAFGLIGSDLPSPQFNFNWWLNRSGFSGYQDYGPRRIGTPEDPFRDFAGGYFSDPNKDNDRYYMLAHAEVDYNELEINVHDSTDGWIDPNRSYFDFLHDTRFLYSFGSFDLAPGDSLHFAIAVVGAADFHTNPGDYENLFDPDEPQIYEASFNFTGMMQALRRAREVYRSGFVLPRPGAPAGLHTTEYNDNYASLAWHRSEHPWLAGYNVYVRDSIYDSNWRHAFSGLVLDTTCTLKFLNTSHSYLVTVTQVDTAGRESLQSYPVTVIPGRPHPPQNIAIAIDNEMPYVTWESSDDTSFQTYRIYRGAYTDPLALYDSTAARAYHDYGANSGTLYRYAVSAWNVLNLESEKSDTVAITPMAFDRNILFFDMNFDGSAPLGPYKKFLVDRLYNNVARVAEVEYRDIEEGYLPLEVLSHYPFVIFDSEKRGGAFFSDQVGAIKRYLELGGRGLFIIPNASQSVAANGTRMVRFGPGDYFHDLFKLDSAIINGITFSGSTIYGDLTGCVPENGAYPALHVDSSLLSVPMPLHLNGYIPMSGCLFPSPEADILYRYQSLYTDSMFQGQVNAIRYIDENYGVVFLCFNLSLMSDPAASDLLGQMLVELGADMGCGDVNNDGRFNVGDMTYYLNFLYRNGSPPDPAFHGDVDCNGITELPDVIRMINLIFKGGQNLHCCPE